MSDKKRYWGDVFPIGSVAYFIRRNGWKISVGFGIVKENRTYEIWLDLLEPKHIGEKIDGIPVEDVKIPSHWRKIPKGWTYGTKLFTYTPWTTPEEIKGLTMADPDKILEAYRNGWMVEKSLDTQVHYEAEIDRNHGWRIIRRGPAKYSPIAEHRPPEELYKSYAVALAAVDKELAELIRQRNLTDEEWSIELIEKTIAHWGKIYDVPETRASEVREWLMVRPHLEDVEVRIFAGSLQWKRWKSKKWANVPGGE